MGREEGKTLTEGVGNRVMRQASLKSRERGSEIVSPSDVNRVAAVRIDISLVPQGRKQARTDCSYIGCVKEVQGLDWREPLLGTLVTEWECMTIYYGLAFRIRCYGVYGGWFSKTVV